MRYDFLKKKFFLVGPPLTPQGGYFKQFRLIFVILGFKWHKMDKKKEIIVTKKLHLNQLKHNSPQKFWSDPPGSYKLAIFSQNFNVFYYFLQKYP